MSNSPYYYERLYKDIMKDFKKLNIEVEKGKLQKQEAYNRLARKYCKSRSRIEDIIRENSHA